MKNTWFKLYIKIFSILFFANIALYAAFPQQKFLSPDEAFKVSSNQTNDAVQIKIKLGEKMYEYDDKLHVNLISPKKVLLDKESTRPKPVKFHDFIVHRKDILITVPLDVIRKYVKSGKYKLKVSYQGCSEQGLCYQPMENDFEYTLANKIVKKITPTTQAQATQTPPASEEDKIANTIKNSSFLIVLLTFFGFGLLLALTPCVFPMIPILSSIIVSQSDENMNAKKAFFLSLVYVISMSLAYTIAGILAGLFGANIQTALQNPWVISSFSLVFVLLSFSMFGFYEIQMPNFIQSTCVAAPLAGALVYIGQSGDAVLGGVALFVMSIGMGVPLLIIGAGAGKFMPKPGAWMDNVKAVFGVLMLAVAIWMLDRILPPQVTMLLWMALLLISSIYMGALASLERNASGWLKLFKGIGIIVLIYSIFLFIGAMKGVTNPLNPLKETQVQILAQNPIEGAITQKENKFKVIKTLEKLNLFIKTSNKPIMIDFYADWCVSCKELDKITFQDPRVKEKMSKFNLIRIDVTNNDEEDKRLLKRFNLFGPPGIMFFKQMSFQKF